MSSMHILLIEDIHEEAKLIREALVREAGTAFQMTHADRLSSGLKRLAEGAVDLVLLDLKLPDSEGLETLRKVRARAPQVPIVVLTASDDTAAAVEAVQQGAEDYLVKGYVHVYPTLLGRSIRYAFVRRRAEQAVRQAHAQTEKLLRSIPSILIRVGAAGTITHWNAVAEATFGIAEADVINRPFVQSGIRWEAGVVLDCIAKCQKTNAPVMLDALAFTRPDGRQGFVGMTVVPMRGDGANGGPGALIFGADVTERKQAEAERSRLQHQLSQAQKMETIGRFAGGIAHDFNNFLQVILGFASLLQARGQHDPALRNDVQEIVHAAESASGMVHQLLAFSRLQPFQPKLFDMNQTVRRMARLLQQFAGSQVRVELELAPSPMTVKLDPTGLEQILMNLCSNARDSMPRGGTLTIKTGRFRMDAAFVESHPGAKAGEYISLSIQDTGTGMDPDVASHIFEPFYTTKQKGGGTGLGLAVVYGLVQQHGGFVDFETSPGQGTTFLLYFPYQTVQPEPQAAVPETAPAAQILNGEAVSTPAGPPSDSAVRQAKRSVLVVDDDPAIRRLCERFLKTTYEVTTVPSGRAVLKELGRRSYDLLLCDLRMPGMDGVSLLHEVMKLEHTPRLLAMTGSVTREMQQRLRMVQLANDVVHKPFTAPILIEAISRSLAARQ